MTFKLRPYQERCVNAVRRAFTTGSKGVILSSPTGSGKTVMFSHMARAATSKGRRVMIVCNRKELIEQSYIKCRDYGLLPSIIAPGYPYIKSNCYVSSVDTLLRRGMFPDVDFLIIDEAHFAKFDCLVDVYRGRGIWVLGVTATPLRKGQQRSLHTMYDEIVSTLQIRELISDGYLAPNIVYGPKIDLTALKTKSLEYDKKKLFDFYHRQTMYDGVFEHYNKFSEPGPTICFNVSRDTSRAFVEQARTRGIPAAHVDGSMSDAHRSRIFRDFEKGQFILSNCQIATTGYDFAGIRNVICNFATKSLTKWLQTNGRGGRIDNEKSHFVTIDMGSNVKEHGFWEDDRSWDLVKPTRRSALQAAPVKNCKQCEALIAASQRECPYCGYLYPPNEIKLVEAEFVRLERKSVPPHLRKPIRDMNYPELLDYARFKGYKPGWAWHQLNK